MTETFYDLLGVSEDAATAEIEAAYREAIKEVHPDVSDDVDAGERTKRLNEAKRVLTDETERARYDRLGHAAYTGDADTDGAAGSGSTTDSTAGSAAGPTTDSTAGPGSGRDRSRSGGRRRRRADRSWPGDYGPRSWDDGETRTDTTDATGPSHPSSGPSWQSGTATRASAAGSDGVDSPSARRQAAAGSTDGPNVDWSWNGWERTRSWAVRQGETTPRGVRPSRLFPTEQSVVLLASTFLLYPFFVTAVLYPHFPLLVRVTVAVCTLLMFAYLLSVPEVAVVVYGVWSLLVPVAFLLHPGLSIFSLAGVVGLSATWVPLGLSVLALSVVRP